MPSPLLLAAALTCFSPPVTDGDTFRCDGQRVRLYGVQAGELGNRRTPAERYAYEARDRLRELTRGKVTCVEAGNRRDRYGRFVGKCSGLVPDIGGRLVEEGLARDWPAYSRGAYADEELQARRAKRGMWR